jgi:hypothetical protein
MGKELVPELKEAQAQAAWCPISAALILKGK